MRKAVQTLRTRVGRMQREVARRLAALPQQAQADARDLLGRTDRILTQRTKDKNKLYALHTPGVECISKGKARTSYKFGVKVSIATTLKDGLVVGMRSMPGNPYDGNTLAETLEQVGILRTGQRRDITRTLKAMIHGRSAIEPAIGHMKMDGCLGRNLHQMLATLFQQAAVRGMRNRLEA